MKSYPAHITVNMLAELTGRDRRTIGKKLETLTPVEERAHESLYEIRAALRLIFDFTPDGDQKVDYESDDFQPAQEKNKLDFVKRQAMEFDLAVRRREYIAKDEIKETLEGVFSNIKSKLRAVPTRAAQMIQGPPQKQTEALLLKLVDETLGELAEAKIE